MVEPILYASLGALCATLIGLMFLPFFWRRAVRLTTKQLVHRLPVSAAEITAAQDRMRAQAAMSMRATERKAERAIGEATRDRIESARARATELQHLADLAELRAKVASLETEGARVRSERDRHGAEAASAYDALAEARSAADAAARDLQAARQEASAARSEAEAARNEASGRQAEIVQLRERLEAAGNTPAPEQLRGEDGRLRLPKAAMTFGAESEAPSAADIAALRARLDEVADAIVKSAETLAGPDATPAPAPKPRAPRQPKRMRVFSAAQLDERADA